MSQQPQSQGKGPLDRPEAGGAQDPLTYRGADELDEAEYITKVVRARLFAMMPDYATHGGHPLPHQRSIKRAVEDSA